MQKCITAAQTVRKGDKVSSIYTGVKLCMYAGMHTYVASVDVLELFIVVTE